MSMEQDARRGRELLKPPEVKPLLTLAMMLFCILNTGKGDINWLLSHSISADKIMNGLSANNWAALGILSAIAATGQLTFWMMFINILFVWLFGSAIEKKLIIWRYPVFVLVSIIAPSLLLAFSSPLGTAAYTQNVFGPTMMTAFLLGGYMVFKPKKPFKPQEWKTPKWKVFKGNDATQRNRVKVPWVDPTVYIIGFIAWSAIQMVLLTISRQTVVDATHQLWVGNVYAAITGGSTSGGRFLVLQPISFMLTVLSGAVMAYLLVNLSSNVKYKRAASDMQVQAVLQYKELRALDMNHNQAVEGTSQLIGVPLDVCRDWITKGLQPIKDE